MSYLILSQGLGSVMPAKTCQLSNHSSLQPRSRKNVCSWKLLLPQIAFVSCFTKLFLCNALRLWRSDNSSETFLAPSHYCQLYSSCLKSCSNYIKRTWLFVKIDIQITACINFHRKKKSFCHLLLISIICLLYKGVHGFDFIKIFSFSSQNSVFLIPRNGYETVILKGQNSPCWFTVVTGFVLSNDVLISLRVKGMASVVVLIKDGE